MHGGIMRAGGMAAATMAALSAAACASPTAQRPAPPPTTSTTTAAPRPLVVQQFATATATPLPLPDGACDTAALRLTVSLAAGTVRQGGAILPTATLRNAGARTCDVAPECPTDTRITSDTVTPRSGAEGAGDCMQPPGYVVLHPGEAVSKDAGSFPALEPPGDYWVRVTWGAMESAAHLTVTA